MQMKLRGSMKVKDTHQLAKLQECLKEKDWITSNLLLLKSDETGVIRLTPKDLRNLMAAWPHYLGFQYHRKESIILNKYLGLLSSICAIS